jgi:hypothetical protein
VGAGYWRECTESVRQPNDGDRNRSFGDAWRRRRWARRPWQWPGRCARAQRHVAGQSGHRQRTVRTRESGRVYRCRCRRSKCSHQRDGGGGRRSNEQPRRSERPAAEQLRAKRPQDEPGGSRGPKHRPRRPRPADGATRTPRGVSPSRAGTGYGQREPDGADPKRPVVPAGKRCRG